MTTDDLASRIGGIEQDVLHEEAGGRHDPEARNALRGTDYAKKNLNDLLKPLQTDTPKTE